MTSTGSFTVTRRARPRHAACISARRQRLRESASTACAGIPPRVERFTKSSETEACCGLGERYWRSPFNVTERTPAAPLASARIARSERQHTFEPTQHRRLDNCYVGRTQGLVSASTLHRSPSSRIPRVELPLRLIACDSVAFLNLADELLALTLNLIKIVVGELAPLFSYLALELRPLPFESVLIHSMPPVIGDERRIGGACPVPLAC
jgi:hypothetical protein